MTLKLGSSGLVTSAWTATMRRRFASYALGVDGTPIKVDGYFGYDEEKVQKEYQRRTGQNPTGVVSDKDLNNLGVIPTLISIHGTGQPDPFGVGYPADIARRLLDVYYWRPVGNYPASAVPMNHSADAGEREATSFVANPLIVPGPVAFVDYSQGSICGARVREKMRKGQLRGELIGSASFGNPMRPAGSYAGNVDPGGHGIDPTLESVVAPQFLNLAQKGDLYTTCPDGPAGEWERAIFNMVFSKFTGKDTLAEQIWELAKDPFGEAAAACRAMWNGGMFIAQNPPTAPHVTYHLRNVPGTNVTYYEYAITHLRNLAEARLRKIATI